MYSRRTGEKRRFCCSSLSACDNLIIIIKYQMYGRDVRGCCGRVETRDGFFSVCFFFRVKKGSRKTIRMSNAPSRRRLPERGGYLASSPLVEPPANIILLLYVKITSTAYIQYSVERIHYVGVYLESGYR